ncbi:glycoside-pentoside-hexuronide (GPH):cation symporter [Salmonella enterica]
MNLKSKICYGTGNIGQAAFYNTFSTFLLIYVSTSMVHSLSKDNANFIIELITAMIVIIRVLEIFLDPVIGNIIDNTKTRFGKFKPWQLAGGILSSLMIIPLFTGLFGLFHFSFTLFIIFFVITFLVMDLTYSFRDISYWGMIPAISTSSYERGKYTSIASFTGAIGWNGLAAIVIPTVTYGTFLFTGNDSQGPEGWAFFGCLVAFIGCITCISVVAGTKESDSSIRIQNEKVRLKDVWGVFKKNDQLLWNASAYIFFSLANVITGGVLFFYFKFIVNDLSVFSFTGMLGMLCSLISAPLFISLNKKTPRKYLFTGSVISMIFAYVLFIFMPINNSYMAFIPVFLFLFPQVIIQITAILTFTDSIEYGQLKTGIRNEAVILSVRPMLDKLAGAFSNGIISLIIVSSNMSGDIANTAINTNDKIIFSLYSFMIPLLLIFISGLIFWKKVRLDEKMHANIVSELQ